MNERPAGSGLFSGLGDGRIDQLVMERLLAPPDSRAGSHPLSDPLHSAATQADRDQQTLSVFRLGFILQAIPCKQCYRVTLDDHGGIIRAARCDLSSRLPIGGRAIGTLLPHTRVLVYKQPKATTGYILAVLPPDVLDPMVYRPSFIWPGGESGYYRDPAHHALAKLTNGGDIRDFGAGTPLDETMLDRGLAFETGLMLQADPFMLQMKVNEFSGLLMTLWDAYVRLGGVNFDFATGVHDQEVRLDYGELRSRMGKSVYFWEALGRTTPGALGEEKDYDDMLRSEPEALYDLKMDERDVAPIYRNVEFDGYEGQGGLRMVQLPNTDSEINHRGQSNGTTVFTESIGLDGSYLLASAKQIAILKRSALPSPVELSRPEDLRGDTSETYKFAGVFGSGPDHKIGDVSYGERTGPAILATLDDLVAHIVNWRTVHPFHYHTKDYTVPEIRDGRLAPTQERLNFTQGPQTLPTPTVMRIDHRWARGQFYARTAGMVFTDDGSVVQFDGYGNQISMGPEGVKITSPNKVMVISGGDVISLGKQVIVKAHDSVDITSSNKDVRIFAKKNLHQSGDGMLLEARSTTRAYDYDNRIGEEVTSTGFVVRTGTDISLLGDNVYLRSGVGDSGAGDIVLDAAKREGNIFFECKEILGYLTGELILFNQAIGGELNQTVVLGGPTSIINSPLVIGGHVAITGDDPSLLVEGNIIAKQNISAVGRMADSVGGFLGDLDDRVKSQVEEQFSEVEADIKKFTDTATEIDNQIWENGWHVDQNVGNDTVLEKMAFSFRDDDGGTQYGVEQLAISEPRWITLARLAGATGTRDWQEEPINYQGKELHSWPGRKNWNDLQPFVRPVGASSTGMYDMANGVEQDRGPRYETPSIPAPEKVSFGEGMRVLR